MATKTDVIAELRATITEQAARIKELEDALRESYWHVLTEDVALAAQINELIGE